jgi:hypothetical protein
MNSKLLVVVLVGAGCVAAAGVGAFLAVQSTAAPSAAISGEPGAQVATTEPSTAGPSDPTGAAAIPAVQTPKPIEQARTEATSAPARRAASPVRTQTPSPTIVPNPQPLPTVPDLDVTASAPSVLTTEIEPESQPLAAPRLADERTIAAESVIGIRLETPVSSETARVEDRVAARVTRDVKVDGTTVIPAGARLDGSVTLVERGGKFRERSRIGIRFTTLHVSDNERLPIETETIFRDGEPPTGEATAKIGASAVVGTILGAVIGGRKGAAIGGAAGAAGGTAPVARGDRNEAGMAAGTPLTVRLMSPVTVLVPRDE